MTTNSQLNFTGERFIPECRGEIEYEHWHRYAFACYFIAKRCVLDVACGEGYGSALLADYADAVIGIDCSIATVRHAHTRYGQKNNLNYLVGDCAAIPLATASVDCVISFETIEHIENQHGMLQEIKRVLKSDGLLIISSPNKKTYSDERNHHNEFHVHEFYPDEFYTLLTDYFHAIEMLNQKLFFHSAIWRGQQIIQNAALAISGSDEEKGRAIELQTRIPYEALYCIALCASEERYLPALSKELWLYSDTDEAIYKHYDLAVRVCDQRAMQLTDCQNALANLTKEIAQHKQQLLSLTQDYENLTRKYAQCQQALAYRNSLIGWMRWPFQPFKRFYKAIFGG